MSIVEMKQKFKVFWNEFVYGGHLLSLGGVSVISATAILLDLKITLDCLFIVYLTSQIIYSYDRYKEFEIDFFCNPERTLYLEKYVEKIPIYIAIYILSVIIILLLLKNYIALIYWIFLIFLGLLYGIFFKKATEKIIGFKNYFVSLMWVLLVVFFIIYYNHSFSLSLFLMCFFIFLRYFIHESFVDIKDIESDEKENLRTLPIIFGEKKLINILKIINILSFFPIICGVYLNFFPIYSLILLLIIPYTLYNFKKLFEPKINKTFLYNVLADGEFILWIVFLGNFYLLNYFSHIITNFL